MFTSERISSARLNELINSTTSNADFEKIIDQVLSQRTRTIIGVDVKATASRSVLFLTAFAPSPATFDKEAFRVAIGRDKLGKQLLDHQIEELLIFCKEIGIIEENDGELSIKDLQLYMNLKRIVEQYN